MPEVFIGAQCRDELGDTSKLTLALFGHEATTHLFLGKTRADADDVDHIPLDNSNVGEMPPAQSLQLLLFSVALLLLLRQALVAGKGLGLHPVTSKLQRNSLLGRHGLELDGLVSVYTTASRATLVEVLFDVMPAETTDLGETLRYAQNREGRSYLISAYTRLKIEIGYVHLF